LLIIGESGVGKTCLLLRFTDDSFTANHLTTIGIDFKIKIINLEEKLIKLQIWDTAGQERFRTITKTYYRGAQGYVLVYDITSKDSFDHVKYWLGEIKKNGNDFVPKVIVGNKSDLEDRRLISTEEGKKFAEEKSIPFMETSAKDGNNVNILFTQLTERFINSVPQGEQQSQNGQ